MQKRSRGPAEAGAWRARAAVAAAIAFIPLILDSRFVAVGK
jgi:hypothetical protein